MQHSLFFKILYIIYEITFCLAKDITFLFEINLTTVLYNYPIYT